MILLIYIFRFFLQHFYFNRSLFNSLCTARSSSSSSSYIWPPRKPEPKPFLVFSSNRYCLRYLRLYSAFCSMWAYVLHWWEQYSCLLWYLKNSFPHHLHFLSRNCVCPLLDVTCTVVIIVHEDVKYFFNDSTISRIVLIFFIIR